MADASEFKRHIATNSTPTSVAGGVRPVTIRAGTTVIRQGDVPGNLSVIRRGSFQVVKDGALVANASRSRRPLSAPARGPDSRP